MIEDGRRARPKPGTTGAAFAGSPSHRCWRIYACAGFVLGWKKLRLEQTPRSRIVTYADDLVILCKKGKADEALQQLRRS